MTKQRRIILEELKKTKTHPTAYQLYDIVRGRLPRISLATVYRNLEVLETMGKVNQLGIGKSRRFDADTHDHNHIRCISCGRVDDYPSVTMKFKKNPLNLETPPYEVIGHTVDFYGICEKCRSRGLKPDRFGIVNGITKN